ncbi:MAG: DNA-binding domain-containing protein [Pseudomonadota bacterium]
MPLKASQEAFAAALLNPEAPVPDGVVNPEGAPAPKRFAVYRNNVTVSLIEALATAFPVVQKIVGDEFFKAMAAEFVRAHPPSSPLLMFYGDALPGFLEQFEPVKHLTYLADVAQLEQLRRRAYHARDAEPLSAEFLATVPPEALGTLRVTFHPAVHILCSVHPVLSIWEWNSAGAPDGTALPQEGEDVVILRPELDVEQRCLPPGGAVFLETLSTGAPLGEAAAAGAAQPGFDLTANITGLLESRIATDFTVDGAA